MKKWDHRIGATRNPGHTLISNTGVCVSGLNSNPGKVVLEKSNREFESRRFRQIQRQPLRIGYLVEALSLRLVQ